MKLQSRSGNPTEILRPDWKGREEEGKRKGIPGAGFACGVVVKFPIIIKSATCEAMMK